MFWKAFCKNESAILMGKDFELFVKAIRHYYVIYKNVLQDFSKIFREAVTQQKRTSPRSCS